MQRKIVIPLLFDYYLYDFLQVVIDALLAEGFDVTLMTMDRRVEERFSRDHPRFHVVHFHPVVRALYNRSIKSGFRLALWLASWLLARTWRREFDFAILPTDRPPIWYQFARVLPSLAVHMTTDFMDADLMSEHARRALTEQEKTLRYRIFALTDRLTGGRFLMRLGGKITRQPSYLWVDRLMGFRGQCYALGFCGLTYLTVTGQRIKEVYASMGLDPRAIHVVGHPGYDHLRKIKDEFDEASRRAFRSDIGIRPAERVFTFFLSPSRFTEAQFEEVVTVVRSLRGRFPDSFVVLKFHPKTIHTAPPEFRRRLDFMADDILLLREFVGDEFNARLILASDAIVQKQSTVGFIAIMFGVPIISYNLVETDYEDGMYRILDASFHAESEAELNQALGNLDDAAALEGLRRRQDVACRNFCIRFAQAGPAIAHIVRAHLESTERTPAPITRTVAAR